MTEKLTDGTVAIVALVNEDDEAPLDLFVNEDVDYANRLIQAGVNTQLLTIPGVFHGFEMLGDTPSQVKLYHTVRDEAIQRMLTA